MSWAALSATPLLAAFLTATVSAYVILRSPTTFRVGPSGSNPCHSSGTKLTAGAVPIWTAIAICSLSLPQSRSVAFLLIFVLGMSLVGWLDDRRPYGVGGKLLAQSPLIVFGLVTLPSFLLTPSWSLLLWFAALTVVVNAMNVVDVADGLAPGSAVVTLSGLAAVLLWQGQFALARLALVFAASTAAFMFYNVPPGRLVLGDTGSLALGGLCAVLTPHCFEPGQRWGFVAMPLLLLLPLFEVCWLSVHRLRSGLAPWRASPHHVVYFLVARARSTSLAVGMLLFFHTLAVGLALWLLEGPRALPWTATMVSLQTALFWGKDKWTKNIKQRSSTRVSQ